MSPLLSNLTIANLQHMQHGELNFKGWNNRHSLRRIGYMDDNKVYAKNANELKLLLGEMKLFSSAIGLEIKTENSAVVNLRGCNTKNSSNQTGISATIEQLDS